VRIVNVVGARPNFVKMAALYRAYGKHPGIDPVLVHTGQHSDPSMSSDLLSELGLPEPDLVLDVPGSASACDIEKAFRGAIRSNPPDMVVVVGDVTSTVACATAASDLGIPVAHVEAGLRSFDPTMPEEANRIRTDRLSDLLLVSEAAGINNLLTEGIPESRIHFVGNVMIDTLLERMPAVDRSDLPVRLGLADGGYVVLTLHRPGNVDARPVLEGLLHAVGLIAREWPVVFPVHPRTRERLVEFGPGTLIQAMPGLVPLEPLGYLDFMRLLKGARVVLTDSGGIQEETTALRVPCVTLRNNTERPATCMLGTNRLAGTSPEGILGAFEDALQGDVRGLPDLPMWDGHAAERVADLIMAHGVATGRHGSASTVPGQPG
jgi:UDP-N-acetylglucosamine 2-epimerase (non-hydrolysing)